MYYCDKYLTGRQRVILRAIMNSPCALVATKLFAFIVMITMIISTAAFIVWSINTCNNYNQYLLDNKILPLWYDPINREIPWKNTDWTAFEFIISVLLFILFSAFLVSCREVSAAVSKYDQSGIDKRNDTIITVDH